MKQLFKRAFPSLFRVEKGERKRKRRERSFNRQKTNSLKCLITNVISSGAIFL